MEAEREVKEMAMHEETYKAIQGEVSKFMSEQQLIDLHKAIENRLCELNQREEAEDKIYNSIWDYVEKYGALNISIARALEEADNQLMIDKEDLKYLLVKHE